MPVHRIGFTELSGSHGARHGSYRVKYAMRVAVTDAKQHHLCARLARASATHIGGQPGQGQCGQGQREQGRQGRGNGDAT